LSTTKAEYETQQSLGVGKMTVIVIFSRISEV